MTRRFLLVPMLLATILFSAAAMADWRKDYPEINFAVVPAENEATVTFDRLSDGNNLPWEPIDTSAYDETIRLLQFVGSLRKRS